MRHWFLPDMPDVLALLRDQSHTTQQGLAHFVDWAIEQFLHDLPVLLWHGVEKLAELATQGCTWGCNYVTQRGHGHGV